MSGDVKLVILLTFGVVIGAWLLKNYQAADSITNSLATNYSSVVSGLLPR